MTSAFIIDVQPKLQQDPGEEAAALLRVMIYKLDSTTFGGDVPPIPRWSGPPHTIVQVQAILYASLAASLFSAFLAMLGKQWLNRYASIDMRGTAIGRSQNRQRKLNGIVVWYFVHVMESLPLMLQFALLLLGCALSLYIWGTNTTVASVLIGVTSIGVVCYGLIVVAGTASASCPYQTPGAQIFRYSRQKVLSYSTLFTAKGSAVRGAGAHLGPGQELDREATALDFGCISWMLQTSLDRGINLLTLKFLASVLAVPGFKATILADCFNILISCVSATGDNRVVVLKGSEQLAEMATTCVLGALSHLCIVDPASNVLEDIRQRYGKAFPPMVDPRNLPFCHTFGAVHNLFNKRNRPKSLDWKDADPSTPENIFLARYLVKIAWSQYRESASRKVPRWVLRFLPRCLLQDPEPPASVIADCLFIVAMDLGCDVSENDRSLDKRYACDLPVELIPNHLSVPSLSLLLTRYTHGLNKCLEALWLSTSAANPSPYSRYGQPS